MVVNDILRFGFAHIQRTAGGSMTAALMRLPGSRRVFPDHTMVVPPETRGYLWFLTVREPFAREWSHYCRRHGPGKRNPIRRAVQRMTFGAYVAAHVADPERWEDHCQAEWLRRIRPDLILRFETLAVDLARLPFDLGTYPRVNAGRPLPAGIYTPEIAGMVRDWAREDFRAFGYDPNAPP